MTEKRMPHLTPAVLSPEQLALYREITGGERAAQPQYFALTGPTGALNGPFAPMLLQPALGDRLQGLGAGIRYTGVLTPRARELAILVVAAHWHSEFERESHETAGRDVGLSEEEMQAIREDRVPELTDANEETVIHIVRALLEGDVDDELWERGRQQLGLPMVFEITTLVGYYGLLAMQMRVFRIEAVNQPSAP